MSYKEEFNFNMAPWRQGLPTTTETPTDSITDQSSDLGDTLELMDKMERAERRGYISITREALVNSGLADKLIPLLNVVYQEYSPIRNQLDVYFEHESLDIVLEGCKCPFYNVNIEEDSDGIDFDIIDQSGLIKFRV